MIDKTCEKIFVPEKPNLILVEGISDEYFFSCFCKNLNREDIDLLNVEGKPNFPNAIKTVGSITSFSEKVRFLGIIRDADDSPEDSFKSVRNALTAANFPAPSKPLEIAEGDPNVCVLLLPGGGKPGELEDLILDSWRDNPVFECVNEYFDCIKNKADEMPRKPSKAKVQVFLGSCKETDSRLGIAAEKKYINLDHSAFDIIRDYFSKIS